MNFTPTPANSTRSVAKTWTFWCATAAALLYAFWSSWRREWVSDDAFISFRYAENLVRGLGLVYNPGERVEGYSNFLWTIWTAFGLWLGQDAERWVSLSGIACYLAALGVLAWNSWTIRGEATGLARWVPIAALLGALHPDWQIFATGGLETSLFALQVTLVYVVLSRREIGPTRAVAAGILLALASMTRPDGIVLAAATGLYVLLTNLRRPRVIVALCASFLVAWVPYTAWRMNYFGDFFPNTYYAKSAMFAWYSQGAVYACLYFIRYWPLLLGPVLIWLAWWLAREGAPAGGNYWRRRVALAALLAVAYTAFVVRVGGDFMFARFLIPITPLLLVLLELGISRLGTRALTQCVLIGIAAAGIMFTPYPLPADPLGTVRGIVFEPNYYPLGATNETRHRGLVLRRFFEGLPVRVAFFGGEARLVYYARPYVAIECVTGLTDRQIARQPLKRRTRIGHEKLATTDYIIGERRAHFSFFRGTADVLHLDQVIPAVEIDLRGVRGRVLTWDPALMDSLRARGASIQDFPADLDRILDESSLVIQWEGRAIYDKMRRFYFGHVQDPKREALLLRRIRAVEDARAEPAGTK